MLRVVHLADSSTEREVGKFQYTVDNYGPDTIEGAVSRGDGNWSCR
jgi:hypothetical protein